MMKKFIYHICILFLISSCIDNGVDPIFDKEINERTNELKSSYIKALTSAEEGWIGYYGPNGETGAFTLLLNFDKDGSVVMKSDYRLGANDGQITYRIDKTLKVELVFETHSILHQIYETDNNGIGGEFVFNITSVNDTEIVLTSKTDNGYNGEEITVLNLVKATTTDWDLTDTFAMLNNVVADANQPVFRSILVNNEAIASFSYDSDDRAALISYMKDGELTSTSVPVRITPSGFALLTPLDIGGTLLSTFSYDSDEGIFNDTENNASLVYATEPAVPLAPYNFARREGLRDNYLEQGKSSAAFLDLFQNFSGNGFTINAIQLRNLTEPQPYVYIRSAELGWFWFDVNYEIKEDGRVYFTLTGATNASAQVDADLQPILDVLVGSSKGYYIKGTGGLMQYTNKTVSLINADNSVYEINFFDF